MKVKTDKVIGFDEDDAASDFPAIQKKKPAKKGGGFQSLGLCGPVLKGLQKRGYKLPTPIQRKSIPLILEGRDVVAMARTGSGKTACFLVPMFEKMLRPSMSNVNGVRALILSPTRELALQTLRFIRELGKFTKIKAIAVLGGDSMEQQFSALHANPEIVVATPGRFLHLCVEMDLKLSTVEYVVFDEADRLFEMGFGEQLTETLNRLPDTRQTVLFSATLPKLLVNFARAGLSDPALIRLDVESKLPDTLDLTFLAVRSQDKPAALLSLLQTLPTKSQTLVFLATKHHVEYCHMILDQAGVSNTFIYSDLDASARKINAAKFQNGNVNVLLVTDIAARGVDIPQLDYVVNYHFPAKAKLFVHRVGRCARAGRTGTAFSFVSAEEAPFVLDLHLFLGRPLNILRPGNTPNELQCSFGKIPETVVEIEQTRLIAWHEKIAELASMAKVCDNGYKKYLRSRPGASAESVKRMRTVDFAAIAAHPFFASMDSESQSARNLLDQMKTYKPKGTIFELNVSAKSKVYEIMKKTKKDHQRVISNFKLKQSMKENDNEIRPEKLVQLTASSEGEIDDTFSTVILGKRKRQEMGEDGTKRKKLKDREHYIPHVAPDRHTEDGLSMNNNFSSEASKVAFDMTEDTVEGLAMSHKLKKWDRVKKKMVGVESAKAGKIQTESGVWISKTYKTNRYADWKEKSRAEVMESEEEEEEEKPVRGQKKDFPNTHWGKHNRKKAEKDKKKAALRKPEQILKARKELHRKQQRSLPRKKKNKNQNNNAGKKKK